MLYEVLKVLRMIEENKLIKDNFGTAFTIAFELARLDDVANALDASREEQFYETLSSSLDTWFVRLEE
jgi:hypothetical protein